jgi:hypothetical protein
MPTIYSKAELKQMLDAFWYENSTRSINGTDPPEWFKKLIDSLSGSSPIIGHVIAVATSSLMLGNLMAGDIIGGNVIPSGGLIFAGNQADASQNGLYTVGDNPGETERHADFPDAASCNGYMFILEKGQSGIGNSFTCITESGDGVKLDVNTKAEGSATTSATSIAVTFSAELKAAPTKIKLWCWDAKGMAILGIGYDPTSLTTTGMTILIPGNDEPVTIIYEVLI